MRGRPWRPGRQTPRVKNGRVQKKHRWDYYARTYAVREGDGPLPIVREPAARGCRHVVSEDDLRRFLALIPDWDRYAIGLRGLVLGDGDDDCMGWHEVGVVCLHAWSSEIEETWFRDFFDEHRSVLDRLMVPYEIDDDEVDCAFTRKTAAGFMFFRAFGY